MEMGIATHCASLPLTTIQYMNMINSHEILDELIKHEKDNKARVDFIDQVRTASNNVKLGACQVYFLKKVISSNISSGKTGITDAMLIATWINSCT